MSVIQPDLEGSAQKVVDRELGDFPGGPVVENPSCNAGNMGSIPGLGTKVPRTRRSTERVPCNSRSLCTTTREPVPHNEQSP